ncbi:MAG: sigma-54-dependent Fis family transcriptional regulator [Gemmatimonadaceae bacterium]|nr:sigma-54-dependent Fis family transcriptional regulator [Gemmatimonadaceae bacterium]
MTGQTSVPSGSTPPSAIRVLLAEDEANLGMILEQYLIARGYAVTMVRNGRDALQALRQETFDVALLDVVMPEIDGLEVLRLTREEPLPPEIIVITGNGTIETALAALRLGAYDFLSKPYRMAEIDAIIRRAWEKRVLARSNHVLTHRLREMTGEARFITQYAPLHAVLTMATRVAPSVSPVLITGEAGTGKRLLARHLHAHGADPQGPFIEAALRPDANRSTAVPREEQVARDLFGVERDVARGIPERQLGWLELASGGTLYLSDVDALPLVVQSRLMDAVDAGSFVRVGGSQRVPVLARLVASTTDDLSRRVAQGTWSAPLHHVLSTIAVQLPPLRDRATDIPLLAAHFALQYARETPLKVAPDALALLEQYRWPGNVNELRAVIERAAVLAVDGRIDATSVSGVASTLAAERAAAAAPVLTLETLERQHIAEVLTRVHWHQGRAAEQLGISPKTLYRKIREFGFRRPSNFRQS